MNRKLLGAAIAGAFCACGAIGAQAQDYRYEGSDTFRIARAPEWNPGGESVTWYFTRQVAITAASRLIPSAR